MDDEESEGILNTLYPIGKERWIKVRYLNRDTAMKSIRFNMNASSEEPKQHEIDIGYQVTAMGMMDEFNPQVAAMIELRGDIMKTLRNNSFGQDKMPVEDVIAYVDSVILSKLQEVKEQSIIYKNIDKERMLSKKLILDRKEGGEWIVKMGDSILETFGSEDINKVDALEFIYNRGNKEALEQ